MVTESIGEKMSVVSKLVNFIQQPWLLKAVLIAAIFWLAAGLICCILGAFGLYAIGRKKRVRPYFPAFFPGGQVRYTLLLAGDGRRARLAEQLMWWCPVVVLAGVTGVVWGAYYYIATDDSVRLYASLVLAAMLAVVALGLYIGVRVMEFRALSKLLNRGQWIAALIGTVFLVPVQRILLFTERNHIIKMKDQSE